MTEPEVTVENDEVEEYGAKAGEEIADPEVTEDDGTAEGGEEEVADEAAKADPAVDPVVDEGITEVQKAQEEANELRKMLRESRRQNALVQAKLARHEKQLGKLAKKDEYAEVVDDDAEPEATEVSELEQLHNDLTVINESRGALFQEQLSMMELNPKFEDVTEVCSQQNFTEIINAVATQLVEEHGGDIETAILRVEKSVWERPNPYKYMYDVIKKYHPKYAQAEKTPEAKTGEKKKPVPAKAPSSVQNMGGGGGKSPAGWSSERIDAMPESELSKVPKDIYESYLAGELP